ncbi:MAG: hypothetical protein K2U26_08120 [Cyclobacteriaceae bacterium]|nr:hypothetical protein [Cyclobacteriaceae bacterium]
MARSLAVVPGDKVNIEVYAKYVDPNSSNWNAMLTTLMGQINAGTAGVVVDGAGYSTSSSTFPYGGLLNTTGSSGTGPRAFLNWLIFDKNFVYKTGGFVRITGAARETGTDIPHERLQSPELSIMEAGYVYIYLSNEETTPVEVYFDDFKVAHTKSPVVQSNDNFAHGMENSSLSYQRESSVKNNFLYNAGSEVQTSIDANIYDMPYRGMDVSIGRMMQVDPMADNFSSYNPYNYSFSNPVVFNDPSGAIPAPDSRVSLMDELKYRNDNGGCPGCLGYDDRPGRMGTGGMMFGGPMAGYAERSGTYGTVMESLAQINQLTDAARSGDAAALQAYGMRYGITTTDPSIIGATLNFYFGTDHGKVIASTKLSVDGGDPYVQRTQKFTRDAGNAYLNGTEQNRINIPFAARYIMDLTVSTYRIGSIDRNGNLILGWRSKVSAVSFVTASPGQISTLGYASLVDNGTTLFTSTLGPPTNSIIPVYSGQSSYVGETYFDLPNSFGNVEINFSGRWRVMMDGMPQVPVSISQPAGISVSQIIKLN